MSKYRCEICNVFEYDDDRGNSLTGIKPDTKPEDFPDDWECPICKANKTHLKPIKEKKTQTHVEEVVTCPHCGAKSRMSITTLDKELGGYLGEWKRQSDELESHMSDIHQISVTGESIIEPMRTKMDVISWDDILIKGAQLAKLPLNHDETVNTGTTIGPKAKQPLMIDTPLYITHMSYGALSREIKISLATGSAAVGTAMCSGEGGILQESFEKAHKYIFEYVPNRYSVTDENLKKVDAIEIKIGQSVKPGMGGQLEALSNVFDLEQVYVFDLDISRAEKFKEGMESVASCDITVVDSIQKACNADILVTTTPSRQPIIKAQWLAEGIHINAIGADARGKEELDPYILRKSRVVVDDMAQATHSGEVNVPLSEGYIRQEDIFAQLGQIVAGLHEGRESDAQITVFDSTGLAIQDIVTANLVYKKAKSRGVGSKAKLF